MSPPPARPSPPTRSTGLAPRRAALDVLRRVRRGSPFDAACEAAFTRLSPIDRRLAHELAAGVLRHSARLDANLAPHVSGGWRSVATPLKDTLRLGAYQVWLLDRVPAHAAVNTSVSLARELRGARAAGFVNAVLRRVSQTPWAAAEEVAGAHDLALHYSHPPWLVDRWTQRFGAEATERLLEWNNQKPTLTLQPARQPLDAIAARLAESGHRTAPAPFGAGLEIEARRPRELPGYEAGEFHVQDPAQALVVQFMEPDRDAIVFDACAAPGGKAIALARSVKAVIAADLRRDRVARMRDNLRRAGTGRIHPLLARAEAPPVRSADIVLLDAPCLATGTMRRHPDARRRVSQAGLARLTLIQAQLLHGVAQVVPSGGLLVYATCSLEPEENEEQIERFLDARPEFEREPPSRFPEQLLSLAGDLRLLPQEHGVDGAYAARLRRTAR